MSTDASSAKASSGIGTPDADSNPLDAKLFNADDFGGVAESAAGSGSLSYSALQAQQTAAQQETAGGAQAAARDTIQIADAQAGTLPGAVGSAGPGASADSFDGVDAPAASGGAPVQDAAQAAQNAAQSGFAPGAANGAEAFAVPSATVGTVVTTLNDPDTGGTPTDGDPHGPGLPPGPGPDTDGHPHGGGDPLIDISVGGHGGGDGTLLDVDIGGHGGGGGGAPLIDVNVLGHGGTDGRLIDVDILGHGGTSGGAAPLIDVNVLGHGGANGTLLDIDLGGTSDAGGSSLIDVNVLGHGGANGTLLDVNVGGTATDGPESAPLIGVNVLGEGSAQGSLLNVDLTSAGNGADNDQLLAFNPAGTGPAIDVNLGAVTDLVGITAGLNTLLGHLGSALQPGADDPAASQAGPMLPAMPTLEATASDVSHSLASTVAEAEQIVAAAVDNAHAAAATATEAAAVSALLDNHAGLDSLTAAAASNAPTDLSHATSVLSAPVGMVMEGIDHLLLPTASGIVPHMHQWHL